MAFRSALLVAFANYLIFFGPEIIHEARHRRDVSTRRQRFDTQTRSATAEPLHHCAICGATEVSDPNLDFRVASRWRGILHVRICRSGDAERLNR